MFDQENGLGVAGGCPARLPGSMVPTMAEMSEDRLPTPPSFSSSAPIHSDLHSPTHGNILYMYTVCPKSLDQSYIVGYYIKWLKTSCKYSIHIWRCTHLHLHLLNSRYGLGLKSVLNVWQNYIDRRYYVVEVLTNFIYLFI